MATLPDGPTNISQEMRIGTASTTGTIWTDSISLDCISSWARTRKRRSQNSSRKKPSGGVRWCRPRRGWTFSSDTLGYPGARPQPKHGKFRLIKPAIPIHFEAKRADYREAGSHLGQVLALPLRGPDERLYPGQRIELQPEQRGRTVPGPHQSRRVRGGRTGRRVGVRAGRR